MQRNYAKIILCKEWRESKKILPDHLTINLLFCPFPVGEQFVVIANEIAGFTSVAKLLREETTSISRQIDISKLKENNSFLLERCGCV